MESDTSEGIAGDDFREILSSMAGWYDHHGYINMLKVLYRDLVAEPEKLYAVTNVIELFELLRTSGHLSPEYLTVLYDTINVTKPFGLEPEIRKLTVKIHFDIRAVVISKFTQNRQNLIKLVESLIDNDVKSISELYSCGEKTDRWELFVDLEYRGNISNMDEFLRKMTTHLIMVSKCDPLGLRVTSKDKNVCTREAREEMVTKAIADDHGDMTLSGGTDAVFWMQVKGTDL